MKAKYFERALKIAELTKPKEREIRAIEFCYKDGNELTFLITFDINDGNNFYVKFYI
jgi:hypothetical protein